MTTMTTTTKINPHSAYGQLLLEKQEMRRLSKIQEEKIAAEWQYVQNHARRFLMSGVSSVLFGGITGGGNSEGEGGGKKAMGVAWHLARPFLLRWAVGAGWKLIRNLFVQKRRG